MDEPQPSDICRVCRCEATPDKPLFHPCICTGSIKWIHQECLTQWMRYSRKEYCELCRYRFTFMPIYDENMPRHLPLKDIITGLLNTVITALKYWLHYTIVAGAWLGVVPIVACRIFSCLFSLSVDSILTLPFDLFSMKNLAADMFQGSFIVTCTLFAFIGLVWLREQILHGGGPEWLDQEEIDHNHGINRPADQPLAERLDEADNNNAPLQVDDHRQEQPIVDDHNNWNPVEWDRAAEELTWERLLGLDGSLIFLEHVFWVVSLNTLFILLFAFLPYNVGSLFLMITDLKEYAKASRFEGLVTTLCGYIVSSCFLVLLHTIISVAKLTKISRLLGLCYIVVKVSLLLVIEIGALPLICGWWLDICSLPVFNATLKDREASFTVAPGTSMFIHWLIGMVFVYYFASFVLVLREVLRPGVLWFLRNLNDPDFSPIQEMIHLSMYKHIRRLMASCVIFGMVVMLILYVPSRILKAIWPSFLPYVITSHSESVNELSLELLLLQVIMPALLEQHYIRQWLRATIRIWCLTVAWCLGLKSYLLGDGVQNNDDAGAPAAANAAAAAAAADNAALAGGGLGAAHQALLQRGGPTGFQPYEKPKWFPLRIIALLILICMTTVVASLIVLTVPVYVGRKVMAVWPSLVLTKPVPKVHELYTASAGMYMLWLMARIIATMISWLPKGKMVVIRRITKMSLSTMKAMFAVIWLVGVIPFLFGLLVELVIVVPMRVPLDQTPVIWTWLDWGLGLLYMKISCALLMMGPDWRIKRAVERTFRNGFQRMNLKFTMKEVIMPVVGTLALLLALPYAIAHGIVPIFVKSFHLRNVIARRIYPFLLILALVYSGASFGGRQSVKWYEHIRNERYLVGRKLINYNHRRQPAEISPPAAAAAENES
ncbi:E3 ubiquitin-protein ligase MARCHF6 [Planococcus citri]|uniref:E3 ubiquitin-protein ligase MARCHF6 n=1 Tax=Planococcus citri TaxID=170843 RepID=UPI0031F8BBAA